MDKKKTYINKLIETLDQNKTIEINDLYKSILKVWKNNKNIFICGNGGSAANANHMANDLLCVANKKTKKGIKVESLSANPAVITCIANDRGYENIFSEQLNAKGNKGDLLLILSGSGNSKNVIKAIRLAKKKGIKSFSILGFDGGECKKISDKAIHYKVDDMQISEDIQMIVFNICMKELMKTKI